MPPHIKLRNTLPFLTSLLILGCEDEGIIRLHVEGELDPAALEFGDVPVSTSKAMPVKLMSVGSAALKITDVEIPEGFSIRGVKGDLEGRTLHSGTDMDFEVVFIPNVEGERSGEVMFHMDEGSVALPVHGNGTLTRLPSITAVPPAINFGAVEIGSQQRATVSLVNGGNADGTIVGASVESTGQPLSQGDPFFVATALPLSVPFGGGAPIELVFAPSVEGQRTDRVLLALQEGVPPVAIDVTGEGRVPFGEIFCEPGRVDFGAVERGQVRSNSVTCTARGGPARLVGAHIEGATDQFFLPSPPNTTDLASEQAFTLAIEFRPEGLPDLHFGTAVVEFTGANGTGTAEVELSGEVIPPPPTETAVSVILSWNTNNTDVDLHFVRPVGRPNAFDSLFQTDADCYFANKAPDWNAAGNATDDPFLDADDVDGFGPETINLESTGPGAYDVFVHYFNDNIQGPSRATVEIHLAGQLAGTYDRPNLSCNQVWHVGTINWNGTNGTFAPSNAVQNSNRGFCP